MVHIEIVSIIEKLALQSKSPSTHTYDEEDNFSGKNSIQNRDLRESLVGGSSVERAKEELRAFYFSSLCAVWDMGNQITLAPAQVHPPHSISPISHPYYPSRSISSLSPTGAFTDLKR